MPPHASRSAAEAQRNLAGKGMQLWREATDD